ncbi:MAG: hypothetical protein ABSC77_07620 [Terracidiphilus sp.]|jgi:hypothetical protein
MKQLAALLVTVALAVPAFAQKPNPQFTQAISKLHIVAPAAKPLLLHTGKPLTQNDKNQFLAALIKTAPASTRKHQESAAPPSITTLSPSQLSQGNAYFILMNPSYVDITHGEVQFLYASTSNMLFVITAQPNTAYLLAIKVNAVYPATHFTIYTGASNGGPTTNPDTFAGSQGDNEFAYGVVSNSTGHILVTIYSADSFWSFTNCEITSTTF